MLDLNGPARILAHVGVAAAAILACAACSTAAPPAAPASPAAVSSTAVAASALPPDLIIRIDHLGRRPWATTKPAVGGRPPAHSGRLLITVLYVLGQGA